MASLPFVGPMWKHRRPLTGERLVIVSSAIAFLVFLLWASIAQVDEVTQGEGKVIPSSKLQVITAAEPATVQELLVRSGQPVRRGQLLARLDNPSSRQIQAETDSLEQRAARLSAEGSGATTELSGDDDQFAAAQPGAGPGKRGSPATARGAEHRSADRPRHRAA